jgi:hypothetical protein
MRSGSPPPAIDFRAVSMNETQVLIIGLCNLLYQCNSSGTPIDTGHPQLKPTMAQVIQ